MGLLEIITVIKEVGVATIGMGLVVWVVVFIVKRLADVIDKLSTKFDLSMSRVKLEHEQSAKEHNRLISIADGLLSQHTEMIATLGRINGYKKS